MFSGSCVNGDVVIVDLELASASGRQLDVPGEEQFAVLGARGVGQFAEEARQIRMRFDAIRLCRFDKQVKPGGGGSAGKGSHELQGDTINENCESGMEP